MNLSDYPDQVKDIGFIARKLYRNLYYTTKIYIELDDLMQAGYMGLMDAVSKNNLTSKPLVRSYCQIRIWGSMMDEIRRFGPLSKHTLKKGVHIGFMPFEEIHHELVDIDTDLMDLDKMLNGLHGREKRIIDKCLKGKNQVTIGRSEGLSESRITQIIKKVVKDIQLEYIV